MPWNSLQFMDALNACGNRYEADNEWFIKKWWGDQVNYSLNAWKLYHRASTSSLGMLLLGSAKIREDPTLLGSFGMTSGSGTDDKTRQLIEKLQAQRTGLQTAPGLRDAPKVVGPGSVLSDKRWTPLLNDCYILGGAHAGFEFHYAEDAADAEFARMPPPLTPVNKWQAFLMSHPETFWDQDRNVPRILSRELIGLKTFGYRPQFFLQQLSFKPSQSGDGTFTTYLDALAASGYTRANRKQVIDAISLFLFGNVYALR
jgi:hypothetical protein